MNHKRMGSVQLVHANLSQNRLKDFRNRSSIDVLRKTVLFLKQWKFIATFRKEWQFFQAEDNATRKVFAQRCTEKCSEGTCVLFVHFRTQKGVSWWYWTVETGVWTESVSYIILQRNELLVFAIFSLRKEEKIEIWRICKQHNIFKGFIWWWKCSECYLVNSTFNFGCGAHDFEA